MQYAEQRREDVRMTYRRSKNAGAEGDTHVINNDRSEERCRRAYRKFFYISYVPRAAPPTSVRMTDMHAPGVGFEIRKQYICAFMLALVLVLGHWFGS